MDNDMVCGTGVDHVSATAWSDFDGQTYYFCSTACKEEFDFDPEQYLQMEGVAYESDFVREHRLAA
jgi:YHS domain-containing protein